MAVGQQYDRRHFILKSTYMATIRKQVTEEQEGKLNDIVKNSVDEVTVRGRKYKVRWLHNGTIRKLTDIMLAEGDESKVSCKCAAAIALNGCFRIKLLWWAVWRWFYYVREYYDAELFELIETAKKKVPAEQYYMNTILLIGMRDTMMNMTRKETKAILQGLSSERHTQSGKTDLG